MGTRNPADQGKCSGRRTGVRHPHACRAQPHRTRSAGLTVTADSTRTEKGRMTASSESMSDARYVAGKRVPLHALHEPVGYGGREIHGLPRDDELSVAVCAGPLQPWQGSTGQQ